MKTVGVIGGLGPETTAEFYLETIFTCFARQTLNRPPMLIWSVPLPYKIEEELIVSATGEERYLPYLIDAAKRLEKGGADFLVMPCNSLHIFIEEMRKSVHIPVLSIAEETVAFLRQKHIREVGVLATSATIQKNMYQSHLEKLGIQQVLPNENQQQRINHFISRLVLSKHNEKDKKELMEIIEQFVQKGVKTVILACTDLQLLTPKHPALEIFDTMKILADATVRAILEQT